MTPGEGDIAPAHGKTGAILVDFGLANNLATKSQNFPDNYKFCFTLILKISLNNEKCKSYDVKSGAHWLKIANWQTEVWPFFSPFLRFFGHRYKDNLTWIKLYIIDNIQFTGWANSYGNLRDYYLSIELSKLWCYFLIFWVTFGAKMGSPDGTFGTTAISKSCFRD